MRVAEMIVCIPILPKSYRKHKKTSKSQENNRLTSNNIEKVRKKNLLIRLFARIIMICHYYLCPKKANVHQIKKN